MSKKRQQNQHPSKGFLVVGSTKKRFYQLAINLIGSIKDFYPDAKICLVTEERFCDGNEKIADHLIYCNNDTRSKLWALDKTPFDITMYIDADSQIEHEDITTAFDYMKDNDVVFVKLYKEADQYFAIREWSGEEMKLCGGVVLYDMRKPIVKEFLKDWWEYYKLQRDFKWWPDLHNGQPDYTNHPIELKPWDQFTLWWLTEKCEKYKNLKIGEFDNDFRWNWYAYYSMVEDKINPNGMKIIINHMSGVINKD